jgi:hypothetical protein
MFTAMQSVTIGKLARAARANLETLCHYERIHRIKIKARADANLPRRGRPVRRRGTVV